MTAGEWVPPVDIYADGDRELVLKAELPGMTLDDIDVSVDNGALTSLPRGTLQGGSP